MIVFSRYTGTTQKRDLYATKSDGTGRRTQITNTPDVSEVAPRGLPQRTPAGLSGAFFSRDGTGCRSASSARKTGPSSVRSRCSRPRHQHLGHFIPGRRRRLYVSVRHPESRAPDIGKNRRSSLHRGSTARISRADGTTSGATHRPLPSQQRARPRFLPVLLRPRPQRRKKTRRGRIPGSCGDDLDQGRPRGKTPPCRSDLFYLSLPLSRGQRPLIPKPEALLMMPRT